MDGWSSLLIDFSTAGASRSIVGGEEVGLVHALGYIVGVCCLFDLSRPSSSSLHFNYFQFIRNVSRAHHHAGVGDCSSAERHVVMVLDTHSSSDSCQFKSNLISL